MAQNPIHASPLEDGKDALASDALGTGIGDIQISMTPAEADEWAQYVVTLTHCCSTV